MFHFHLFKGRDLKVANVFFGEGHKGSLKITGNMIGWVVFRIKVSSIKAPYCLAMLMPSIR